MSLKTIDVSTLLHQSSCNAVENILLTISIDVWSCFLLANLSMIHRCLPEQQWWMKRRNGAHSLTRTSKISKYTTLYAFVAKLPYVLISIKSYSNHMWLLYFESTVSYTCSSFHFCGDCYALFFLETHETRWFRFHHFSYKCEYVIFFGTYHKSVSRNNVTNSLATRPHFKKTEISYIVNQAFNSDARTQFDVENIT